MMPLQMGSQLNMGALLGRGPQPQPRPPIMRGPQQFQMGSLTGANPPVSSPIVGGPVPIGAGPHFGPGPQPGPIGAPAGPMPIAGPYQPFPIPTPQPVGPASPILNPFGGRFKRY